MNENTKQELLHLHRATQIVEYSENTGTIEDTYENCYTCKTLYPCETAKILTK